MRYAAEHPESWAYEGPYAGTETARLARLAIEADEYPEPCYACGFAPCACPNAEEKEVI